MSLFVLMMTLWGRAGNEPTLRVPTPIASSWAWAWATTLAALIGVLLLNYWMRIWLILSVVVMMIVVLLDWFSRLILHSVVVVWGGWMAWLLIVPVNLHGTIFIVL